MRELGKVGHTVKRGSQFTSGVADCKYLWSQCGFSIHNNIGLGSSSNGSHSPPVAGEAPHVLPTVVDQSQPIAATVEQCRIVDKVDRRAIVS